MTRDQRDTERRCLPVAEWPAKDQEAWRRVITNGHILDEPGAGAHWAPDTRGRYEKAYGRWLSYLTVRGLIVDHGDPEDRVRPEIVPDYVARLREQVAPGTVCTFIDGLHKAIRAMVPDADWSWLQQVVNRLRRAVTPVRRVEHRLRPAQEIYAGGLRLMDEAERRTPRLQTDQSSWFRDGLMVALLIARPLRVRNFGSIELGRHLFEIDDSYWLSFAAEEMKNRRPLEFPLPDDLRPHLDRYLTRHRPKLLQGNVSDALWISNRGCAMPPLQSIAMRIPKVTQRLFGEPISPHLFRHCAATSIAVEDPEHVRIVKAILGHASFHTSERYYIKAHGVAAGRRHQRSLADLRRSLPDPYRR